MRQEGSMTCAIYGMDLLHRGYIPIISGDVGRYDRIAFPENNLGPALQVRQYRPCITMTKNIQPVTQGLYPGHIRFAYTLAKDFQGRMRRRAG